VSGNNEVELKGDMYTFMSLRLHTTDLDLISKKIAEKVQQAPGFFKDTPVVVDLSLLEESVESASDFDTDALLESIRAHKLVPIVVSVTSKSSPIASPIALPLIESGVRRRSAAKAGTNDSDGAENRSSSPSLHEVGAKADKVGKAANSEASNSDSAKPVEPNDSEKSDSSALDLSHAAAEVQMVIKAPLLINRPVRSGQQVYARDTDLIIMGQVGPGAEVIADNNIHVYGPLRGRALCGVSGNSETRIFCQSLEAELVSVAGNFRVLEEIPENCRGKPAQIWFENDKINIEPL